MSLSQDLDKEIQNGRKGKTGVIPVAYDRVKEFIDIAKNTYFSVAGESGAGKSSLVQDMFILNPIEWYLKNKSEDIKLSVIYFGMERKLYQYSARWVSRWIFQSEGIMISPKRILGRKKEDMLSDSEYDLVQEYYSKLDEWEKDDVLLAHQNSKNPTGISKYLEAFAKKHGVIHDKVRDSTDMENILETKSYTPNHPNHIVLVITDHIGILAPEKGSDNKVKTQIDKFSRTMREARDVYGFSPVIIQQLNRNMSDVHRQKLGELSPKLSDFADSSQTQQDSDVIMAIYDPYRHTSPSEPGRHNGYELKKLKDKYFRTYYRSLHILKNSFDSSGMEFPMALDAIRGIFKTLPRSNEIPEDVYDEVMTGKYFLDAEVKQEQKIYSPFKGFGNRDTIMNEVKIINYG